MRKNKNRQNQKHYKLVTFVMEHFEVCYILPENGYGFEKKKLGYLLI